jgi:hypothetical protein
MSTGTTHCEAAKHGGGGSVEHGAVRAGAGDDHRLDAAVLQHLLEVGVDELVGPGLDVGFIAGESHLGQRIADHGAGNEAVHDQHILGARFRHKLLRDGQRQETARPPLLVAGLLEEIEHQQRRGLGVDGDFLERGRRRCLDGGPFVDDGLLRHRGLDERRRGKRGEREEARS